MKEENKPAGKEKPRGGMGISARIVLFFTAFVLLILCFIYVVQIGMLGMFYRSTKYEELGDIADVVGRAIGTDEASDVAFEFCVANRTCLAVYRVSGNRLSTPYLSVDESQVCIIHSLSGQELEEYYRKAVRNGGKYMDTVPSGNAPAGSGRKSSAAILVKTLTGPDGKNYAMFLNTELTPIGAVSKTLETQFSWLTLAILLVSVVVAYLFSIQISRPLVRMNAKAKKLAKGDYTPDFREEGYRETCELAATLNYAASEISRSDRLRRELISNVSHDLRTPLTMISGYAEVMRDIPGENTPENVQMIIDESKHLSDLVNDMLDLSKIEAGVKKLQPERFSLTDAVRNVMTRYSALTEHSGYTIRFEEDGEAYVTADRTMLLQVIYNLVNNAVNYTGEDRTVTVTQTLSGLPDAGRVRISIRDTGEGISSENIENIWERYYREDGNHRRAVVGTGLGLSIVKDILQKHGASFGVESTRGVGSVFWFELPAESENAPRQT